MVNELSKALSVAEMKVQYDVQCRKVLAQKEVLAWILKNTAPSFLPPNALSITRSPNRISFLSNILA